MIEYEKIADLGLKPQQVRRAVLRALENGTSISIAEIDIVLTPDMLPAIRLWDAVEKLDASKRTKGGRPSTLSAADEQEARRLWSEGKIATAELAERFGISRASLFRLFGPRRAQS